MGGITKNTISQSLKMAVEMFENKEKIAVSDDYRDVNVSTKVVKIIQSYTDIINRTVWRK